ncbi:MAG: hypothetical protein HOM68_28465 [Gemmatimonadetes bacterium]|jgi:hypothetical protein|nr:hypothetical protein [Gemmatimonadota bacterium]MBT5060511.1 hypothetical protein [Gemmatimonadota bacterium]MBT5142519.1 hypothetical protein [Gemmatimonadota bacterium]MBT5587152.1 hypothetical protein [Gemmatimonadota bacterium]MBT5961184.1 hypothetical protein [Gemmatimonadota bacterium]
MFENRLRQLCRSVLVLSVLLVGGVNASTVELLDVEQLSERSVSIYQGTIIGSARAVSADQTASTRIRLALTRVLKADRAIGSDTIDVTLPGGIQEGRRYEISGMPQFRAGEEVILFLSESDRHGRQWPIGLGQAKFTVLRQAGRPARVKQSLQGLHLLDLQGARKLTGAPGPVLLNDLLRRIESVVGITTTVGPH